MKLPNLGKKAPKADAPPPDETPQPGAQAPQSEATEPADDAPPVEPDAAQAEGQPATDPEPPAPPPPEPPSLAEQLAAVAAKVQTEGADEETQAAFAAVADRLWNEVVLPAVHEQSKIHARTQAVVTMPGPTPDGVMRLLVDRAKAKPNEFTAGLSKTVGYPPALLLNWGPVR